MRLPRSFRAPAIVALAAVIALAAGAASAAHAQAPDSVVAQLGLPWTSDAQWLSFRGGYAKSGGTNAPATGFGVGVGYTRMLDQWKIGPWTLFKHFSLGAHVHVEHFGSFGRASEYSIPMTVELDRHFRWTTYMRPYLGVGGGAYYRKFYRTGEDTGQFEPGGFFVMGMNAPVDRQNVLGVDLRYSVVDAGEDNPVFLNENSTSGQWSLKLNWALAY
jgi:hypothetical protein